MQLLQRIWEDIRRGENIDLYVTVIVAVALTTLNLAGLAPQSWIAPINLAVLGLLAIATLVNRYKMEEVLRNLTQAPGTLFLEKFPANLEDDFEKSTELWLVGVTLNRTVKTYYSLLERALKRGNSIKVLLIDPNGTACKMAAMRIRPRTDVEQIRAETRGTLTYLCDLQRIAPDKLEIRTIEHPLSFGAFVIDPEAATGVLYLEHYPFKTIGRAIPKLVLRARDGRWYDFFKAEIRILWEHGIPWRCQSLDNDS